MSNVRLALRSLRKSPTLTGAVLLTLADALRAE
jgi:hypothetical protein